MKKVKLLIVSIFTFFFMITGVLAQGIETDRLCSIDGRYNYGDVNITDTNVYLYHIADMGHLAKYTYVNSYVGYPVDINTTKEHEWAQYTKDLNKYIEDNGIKYDLVSKSDSNGTFTFKDLKVGLYLLKVDSKRTKDYEYSSAPVLISLPNYNEITEVFMYDLSVFTKTEAKSLNVNPGGTVDPPYTVDNIYVYILIFGLALIVFTVSLIYINKKRKGGKSEKNN